MKALLFHLRALIFFAGLVLAVLIIVPPLICTLPANPKFRIRFSSLWFHYIVFSLRVICGVKIRVTGRENLPATPAIFFCKHQSTLETFVLQALLPTYSWVLKKQVLSVPVLGWGVAAIYPIAIDRTAGAAAVTQVVDQGLTRLRQGIGVLIFPEGTRTPPGETGRYKIGGGKLAVAAGAYPVVPIAHNAGLVWPSKKLLVTRPGEVEFVIGEPFSPAGMDAAEVVDKVKAWIEPTTAELLEKAGFQAAPASGAAPE